MNTNNGPTQAAYEITAYIKSIKRRLIPLILKEPRLTTMPSITAVNNVDVVCRVLISVKHTSPYGQHGVKL